VGSDVLLIWNRASVRPYKKVTKDEMELLIILILFILMDLAACRWGFKNGEAWNSAEWERRRNWKALH